MSLFSKRKKLIISGCSYTDNYVRQHKLPEFLSGIWGEILAEKLDMDLINLGRCGYGNQAIYTTIIEKTLEEKNIGLVVALWSEVQRVSFYEKHGLLGGQDKNYWKCFLPERVVLDAEWHDKFYKPPVQNPKKESISYKISTVLQIHRDINHAVIESVNYFYSFQSICENLNIPYLQAQGCPPLMAKTPDRYRKDLHTFSDAIIRMPHDMTENFIGWPIIPLIGGYSMDSKLEDIHRLSPEDTHPNAEGHKFIYGVLYDEYKKIYS